MKSTIALAKWFWRPQSIAFVAILAICLITEARADDQSLPGVSGSTPQNSLPASGSSGTAAPSAAPAQPAQSSGPTAEQTIAWMKAHFKDLGFSFRATGQYDVSGTTQSNRGSTLGVATQGDRYYGGKGGTYVLVPMEITIADDLSYLTLKIFELHQYRYSGTNDTTVSYSGDPNQNDNFSNQDVAKYSQATVNTLTINLKAISIAPNVDENSTFHFELAYLSYPDLSISAPSKYAGLDAEMSTDKNAYQNAGPIYELVIRQKADGGISNTLVYSNNFNNYDNLPPRPAFWMDPSQDDVDPGAILKWIVDNSRKGLEIETIRPGDIVICGSDPKVLEHWRKALQRAADLNVGSSGNNDLFGK